MVQQRVIASVSLLMLPSVASVSVGWGFVKHGGFPANPWASWQMNHSTTAYFVGNASGMDSLAELSGEVRLGYVGIGWQLDNIPSHYSDLEKYEIEEANRCVREGRVESPSVDGDFNRRLLAMVDEAKRVLREA